MKLPLPSLLTCGFVFLTEYEFPDGTRKPKFFVVLGIDQSRVVHSFITTSRLEYFRDQPQLESEIVRVEPGAIQAFTRETGIDCRELYRFSLDNLVALYERGGLIPHGHLPAPLMRKVFATVRGSRLLTKKERKTVARFEPG